MTSTNKPEKMRLTPTEIKWVFYDIGNSAFILLATTLIPIFFKTLTEAEGVDNHTYLVWWGYSISIATVATAILGPIIGTIADRKNRKKLTFLVLVLVGVISCAIMPLFKSWIAFLIICIICKIAYNLTLVVNDSMLPDITTPERMDVVSSNGYAWGYIGSVIPFIASLALSLFYEKIGISSSLAMILVFLLNALWWFGATVPLLRSYKQINYVERKKHSIASVFRQLGETLIEITKQKNIWLFLIAFFFFIDGVYTIIDMAVAYGQSLGLDDQSLLIALLVTQIVAFPFALIFAYLSKRVKNTKLIMVCIIAYTFITLYAIQLDREYEFWILAVAVGMFQGGIQALSRAYFARIIPPEKSGEYFGIYDICGKGASFMGTTLVAAVTQLTGHQNIAIGALVLLFIVGFIFFLRASKLQEKVEQSAGRS